MKLKHFIMLFAAVLSFAACAEIPPVKETVPTEQQIISAPPEGGWTAEELMASSYIFGTKLEYPLTLRSLGSGFSVSDYLSDYNSEEDSEDKTGSSRWYYLEHADGENSEILLISPAYVSVLYENTADGISADEEVSKLQLFCEYSSINGVKYHTSEKDIEKLLGKPDEIIEGEDNFIRYIYCDRESGRELIEVSVSKKSKEVTNILISL